MQIATFWEDYPEVLHPKRFRSPIKVDGMPRNLWITYSGHSTQLARDALEGTRFSDLQTFFPHDLQVNCNPISSLMTPSAVLVPGSKVMSWDEWMATKTVIVRRTRRKEEVPEGQMGLGFALLQS